MDENQLAISALQHYAYCPRQFALIHIEQVWAENHFTAEGRVLHERVDSGVAEQRRGTRFERGVLLLSQRYGLTGKMDLLEIESGDSPRYFPVEYKRGKPKVEDWDRIQLCAQALCIEEMRNTQVTEGAIWYWEVRRREPIMIDDALRSTTVAVIDGAHALLASGKTPPPIDDKKRCKACSLVDLCQPDAFRRDHTAAYIHDMFAAQPAQGDNS
ncbi:MAG: CRISPR-associated exonuclease Cas4 [Pseudomonadota bacterium]|nr:CRISPR-associated exonuclease Cas4 [Pseudomonadota bacterium]